MELEGRRVLITGASSGVGAAAAVAFADAGCDVALLARGAEGLEAVARRARGRMPGTRVLVLPCDLRDAEAVAAAVARVDAEWGGLDVLVPNAAATLFGPFAAADADAFEAVVDTNLMGNVRAVRAALPLLERSGGTIVATGSLNARSPLPDWSSYAASKHGLRGFYNTLRVELRASGSPVTVSQVHPGAIATPVWDVIMGVVHRYYLTGRRPAPRPGALVQPTARGVVRGTMLARPSLTSRLRFRR